MLCTLPLTLLFVRFSGMPTRPLDYDFLRDLPPASQRLYELISYQIFAALNRGNPRARYLYSDFCKYAPLTRYQDREDVRKQLHKIHAPHLKAGYIKKAELELMIDENGDADWIIWYTPGPKAKREFKEFNSKKIVRLGPADSLCNHLVPHSLNLKSEWQRDARKRAFRPRMT